MMLGGSSGPTTAAGNNAPAISNDMMDLFGGSPSTQTNQAPAAMGGSNDLMGILGQGSSGAQDMMGFGVTPQVTPPPA